MFGRMSTVAFVGIEAKPVQVEVRITPGKHVFSIVGLPDKAVAESRERVRNALHAIGLGLPWTRLTVSLAPGDLPKEGSHFDLPIALAMMVAMGAVAPDAIEAFAAIGELQLDGQIRAVPGALPAAVGAECHGQGADLPGGLWSGGGVGGGKHERDRRAAPDLADQPLPAAPKRCDGRPPRSTARPSATCLTCAM